MPTKPSGIRQAAVRRDLEPGLIVIFPIINTPHSEAAVGIELKYSHEIDILQDHPDIRIADAEVEGFDNAAFYMNEKSIHTMSMADLDSYADFLHDERLKDEGQHWVRMVEGNYFAPEHAKLFRESWFYLRPWGNRKFRRIPQEFMTNQCRTALFEFMGWRTPNHMRPTEFQGYGAVWGGPSREGGGKAPASDGKQAGPADELKVSGTLFETTGPEPEQLSPLRFGECFDGQQRGCHVPQPQPAPYSSRPCRRLRISAPTKPTSWTMNRTTETASTPGNRCMRSWLSIA